MPGKGYSTIGVKPAVMERLQQITDKNYLGMFLPSTLIIMMNEVKAERYTIHAHKLRLDLTGRYNTCLLYTSPSPRDRQKSRMPSSA